MLSPWFARGNEQGGTYMTIAQTDLPGEHINNESTNEEQETLDSSADDRHNAQDITPEGPLLRISAPFPPGALYIAIVELCERFAYYGLSGPFQNYIANSPSTSVSLPGALGYGQARATALTNLFQCWCYLTPVLGAVVADQWWGKYTTIKRFSAVYMVGIGVLCASSVPGSRFAGVGLGIAMGVIGLGTGGIKSNVSPLIAEQVTFSLAYVKTIKGKRMLVDPGVTLQRVFMFFYTCINVGSVAALGTTILEKYVGFWAAYLVPLIVFGVGFVVLVKGRNNYVVKPPQGGVIGNCFRALWIAVRNGGDLEKAKPSLHGQGRVSWDNKFIEELKIALVACRVFLFFPIYWLTFSQMMNNFVSQGTPRPSILSQRITKYNAAGQMHLHGLPNDMLPTLNPLTIILLIPLMDRIIYPFLRTHYHLALTPTTRISLGFLVAALAMAYAGGLQIAIYRAPSNSIHIAYQTPAYVLIAVSEILASITGLEVAYAKAPENMKSFIMSLFLLTSAGGSALGIVIAPLARNPYLQWMYFGLAVAAAGTGLAFWRMFRGIDDTMAKTLEHTEAFELRERFDV
jgi:dipeptide/tripeptide permease